MENLDKTEIVSEQKELSWEEKEQQGEITASKAVDCKCGGWNELGDLRLDASKDF